MTRVFRATRVRLAVLSACLLLGAATTGAQNQAAPPGATQTTINIHGRWTIEVREQDGAVVQRVEFDNALDDINGQRVLAGLLGRFYRHIPQWTIRLTGPPLNTCEGGVSGCLLREHLGAGEPPMGAMKVSVPTFAVNPGGLIPSSGTVELVGMARFSLAGSIQRVGTELSICPDSSCAPPAPHFYPFTAHTLPTPINVAANQIVQVTVVLSFS